MTHRIETTEVNGSPMEVFIFEPQGTGPHPGLMQCMHIPVGHTGIENDSFTLKSAQRYADNGYVWRCHSFFIGGPNLLVLRSRGMNSETIGPFPT